MCSLSGNGEECSEVVEGASVMMNPSVGAAHQGLNEWRSLFILGGGAGKQKHVFGSCRLHSNEEGVRAVLELLRIQAHYVYMEFQPPWHIGTNASLWAVIMFKIILKWNLFGVNFHCFTVHFDSLNFIHTTSCTFSYNHVLVF